MFSRNIDAATYRRALGSFATGVAVITTNDSDGKAVGITVNSFNSVSLDPPLVLWSIANNASNYDTFVNAQGFAVNVLAVDQREICARFANSRSGDFDAFEFGESPTGLPLVPDCSAVFACETESVFAGGDHQIILGRVLEFEDHETDPLIFYRGHFRTSQQDTS